MMRILKISCLIVAVACTAATAQSPPPIIVQAASAVPPKSTTTSAPVAAVSSVADAVKLLEKIKSDNDEVLAKQKAALDRLDELQEAADQLRIFAKRG